MQQVAAILEDDPRKRLAVVLSACRGITDALLGVVAAAEQQAPDVPDRLTAIRQRHVDIAETLLTPDDRREYFEALDKDCRDVQGSLETVRLIRSAPGAVRDLVVGFGEIWSTCLFTRYLTSRGRRPGRVRWLDTREVIRVEWGALGPAVRWPESRENARLATEPEVDETLIVTGFIARDIAGLQTTLGRNGSDFTASIMGNLLDADEIHIWTDVDGVLSADPRLVPDATVIDSLSYEEAMELAYFGAKVIHPQTMAPAITKEIPIWIRNTFAPENERNPDLREPDLEPSGQRHHQHQRRGAGQREGAGMIGVPGTAQRLFGALREHGVSVILISQASSEHSICFAIPQAEAERTAAVVRHTFRSELRAGPAAECGCLDGLQHPVGRRRRDGGNAGRRR